jgi:hypothetical protein
MRQVHNWRGEMARVRVMQAMEERHQSECTFNPTLIAKRSKPAPPRPLVAWPDVDLSAVDGVTDGTHRGGVLSRDRDRDAGRSPAKPRLHMNLKAPESMTEDIERYRREKEEFIRQVKAEREIRELQQCTFHPTTNRTRVKKKTVIVRGLGKYLETREHALKLRKEKQEREEKVFTVKAPTKGPEGTTIVRPFNLSKGVIKRSKEAVKEEVEREMLTECTFKPRTVESVKREAIQRLLNDSTSEASSC